MLRHSVQNDHVNLDCFHCEGCRNVRDTCPSDRIKERLDRITVKTELLSGDCKDTGRTTSSSRDQQAQDRAIYSGSTEARALN
jgi:hypothetical protein